MALYPTVSPDVYNSLQMTCRNALHLRNITVLGIRMNPICLSKVCLYSETKVVVFVLIAVQASKITLKR